MHGVIVDMAFTFYDAFIQMWSMCDWNVNLLSKTAPKRISQELFYSFVWFAFCHDVCFYAIDANKMTLIWVRFHLVVIKPFEVSVLTKHDSKRN